MRLLIVVAALALFGGCAQVQSFRVVDAQSGEPIGSLDAERLEGKVQLSKIPLVLVNNMAPVEQHESDASGVVKFGQGSQFAFNPRRSSPEYGRAFVIVGWSGVKIRYPDEYREVAVKPVDGVVEVPLHRRGYQARLSAMTATKPRPGEEETR